jgi:CubicO group peptidase (beta-lactamase class C family)
MRSSLKLALAIILEFSGGRAACSSEWTAYSTARVDALVERFRTQTYPYSTPWAPSLSIAVGIDGRLAFARGFGEARPGYLATEHSIYHIGSLTKQFTAAAILCLIESGAKTPLTGMPTTLETPLRDFFQGATNWGTGDTPPVTLRSLLTMTSTLPKLTDHAPLGSDPWGTIAAEQMLDELKKLPTSGRSTTFEYSNTSYFLLAQVIEAANASGATYREFLRSTLIEKAGLKETGFINDYEPGTALAVASPSWGPNTPQSRRRPAYVEADWLKGSADMASSAFDLFMWDKALMEDKIMSRSSRALMFSDAARVGYSRSYGMGWFIEHTAGADNFVHTGLVPGFSSLNLIVSTLQPGSWISVSLLTNGDGVQGLDNLAASIAEVARH